MSQPYTRKENVRFTPTDSTTAFFGNEKSRQNIHCMTCLPSVVDDSTSLAMSKCSWHLNFHPLSQASLLPCEHCSGGKPHRFTEHKKHLVKNCNRKMIWFVKQRMSRELCLPFFAQSPLIKKKISQFFTCSMSAVNTLCCWSFESKHLVYEMFMTESSVKLYSIICFQCSSKT